MRATALRRPLAAGLALSVLAAPASLLHAAGSMPVSVEGCGMSSDEVTRLVQLELSSVLAAGADPAAYRVTIRCDGADLHLSLFDPLTRKSLARTVARPPPTQPEPERLVALTVAQLYRAAWLELTTDDPPPLAPSPAETRPPEEIASARRAAAQTLAERPPDIPSATPMLPTPTLPTPTLPAPTSPGGRSWSLGVALGARVRHAEDPLVLPNMEVFATWASTGRSFWLLVQAGMEWADVARETGMLETLLVRGGAGIGATALVSGRWSTFVEAAAGLTHLTISGHAARPPYTGERIAGAGFDSSVALGVAVNEGPVRLELTGRAGLLAGTPTGIVAGDEDLSLDGAWGGVDLRFRWGW